MAKKEKTLLLRNTVCDFVCPWIDKLDGSKNHKFVKGEIFEVPATIERIRNGEPTQVDTLEVLRAAFGPGIEEAKGAISVSKMREKDDEIARLKAELAKMQRANKSNTEKDVDSDADKEGQK